MIQSIITVIVFLGVLVFATWLWDLYNSPRNNNPYDGSPQKGGVVKSIERDKVIIREWFSDRELQLVGVEGDGNSDVLVEVAINAIEVPEYLRIIV